MESENSERFLTDKEISDLLSWLGPYLFNSPYPRTNQDVANAWRNILTMQIKRKMFKPEKLKEIRSQIERRFIRGMIDPNTPVGKIIGTSIGEKSTQFTLKLKSNASSSSSGKSVKVSALFQSLIDAQKNPSHQQVEIRFRGKPSLRDLYFRRREFQRLFLTEDFFIEKMNIVSTDLNYQDWYETFEKIYGKSFDSITSKTCLQIQLNVQALYDYRISIEEIAKNLSTSSNIDVFFSPQHIGIIDIYPAKNYKSNNIFSRRILLLRKAKRSFLDLDSGWELDEEEDILEEEKVELSERPSRVSREDEDDDEDEEEIEVEETIDLDDLNEALEELKETENLTEEDMEQMFLHTVVSPLISSTNYGSNDVIQEVFIAWTPYSSTIKKVEKSGRAFIVEFNHEVMRHNGIKTEDINDWLISKGWDVEEIDRERYRMTKGDKSPVEELKEAAEDVKQFEDVVKAYIETNTGFAELIILPDVDTDHSYTDAAVIMKNIFGIEVARVSMNKTFNEIFSGEHSLIPILPTFVVSFMTSSGKVLPMTRNIYRHLKLGPIEQATFEEQHGTLLKGAMFPKAESTRRVETSMIFGSAPPIGTGAVKVYEKPDYQKIREAADLRISNLKEFERQKFTSAIQEFENVEVLEMPLLDDEIDIPELSVESAFIPKIVLPSETEEIKSSTEAIHVVPADSILPASVHVETAEKKEPVEKSTVTKRLVRAVKMK